LPQSARPVLADLGEVITRYEIVRDHARRLAARYPADIWRHMLGSLADIPVLAAEIAQLRVGLAAAKLSRANLAAAALAAIAARRDGESDPFRYLSDELSGQGYDITGREIR
jgi:hypothetical protein